MATPGKPVIRHVPGVRVDISIRLPDGGKSQLAHFSRLDSPSLGRARVGARVLALRHEPDAQGTPCLVGEIAADGALAAFAGRAAEGETADWRIPLANGVATARVLLRRADVPA